MAVDILVCCLGDKLRVLTVSWVIISTTACSLISSLTYNESAVAPWPILCLGVRTIYWIMQLSVHLLSFQLLICRAHYFLWALLSPNTCPLANESRKKDGGIVPNTQDQLWGSTADAVFLHIQYSPSGVPHLMSALTSPQSPLDGKNWTRGKGLAHSS